MPQHPDKDGRKRRFKLRDLVLERIDRVARGDNPAAFIALAKSEPVAKKIVADNGKWCVTDESEEQNFGCFNNRAGAERRLEQIEQFGTRKGFPATPPTVTTSSKGESSMPETVEIDKAALPDDVREYVEELEKRADETQADPDVEKLRADLDYVVEVGKSLDEKVATFEAEKAEFEKATGERTQIDKSQLPEEVVKQLEEAEAQREVVEKLRDERDLEQRVAKAKDYENVGSADDLGDLMHRLAKVADEEDLAKLEETLKAAHESIDTSVIFSEAGARQAIEGSAYQKIQKRAEAIRKDNPDLTPEAAELQAIDENPDLAAEHRAEQGS